MKIGNQEKVKFYKSYDEVDEVFYCIRKIKELGFKGIKVHPAAQEVKVDGRELFEVYAEAG